MKSLMIMIFLLLSSCSSTKIVSSRPESNYSFSIIQGNTDESSAIFRIVYPKKLKVTYNITDSKGKTFEVKKLKTFKRKHSEFKVDHIQVKNLSLGQNYTLSLSSNKKRWKDQRNFKALDTKKDELKILVASCMSDSFNDIGNNIWPKAFTHNPDVTFLIGDNIYADTYSGIYLGSAYPVTPNHLWNRYVDHAMKMKVYRMKNLTPTYVTWDDHDYGVNNGGKNYKYKKEAKKILNIFFPRVKGDNFSFGPGVSTKLQLNKMNFLFLDGRTFRSKKGKTNGSHFGKKQDSWIQKNLDKKDLNWLISGDQFFGGYHQWESFQGDHPKTFKKFLNDIKKSKAKVVFMSGDRHLIEIMKIPESKIGHETYEYTISGIHTKMYPGSIKRDPNPLRVGGFDGVANYAIIRTKTEGNKINIQFEGYSNKGLEVSSTQDVML